MLRGPRQQRHACQRQPVRGSTHLLRPLNQPQPVHPRPSPLLLLLLLLNFLPMLPRRHAP